MRRDISDYLQDILDNINIATAFLNGMNFADFEADQRTIYAVVRAIEIVGEAAKSIPIETRQQYPEIPCRSLTGMRDKMIHSRRCSREAEPTSKSSRSPIDRVTSLLINRIR